MSQLWMSKILKLLLLLQLSNFFSFVKQLQNENDQLAVPNEKQNDFFLLLVVSKSIFSISKVINQAYSSASL